MTTIRTTCCTLHCSRNGKGWRANVTPGRFSFCSQVIRTTRCRGTWYAHNSLHFLIRFRASCRTFLRCIRVIFTPRMATFFGARRIAVTRNCSRSWGERNSAANFLLLCFSPPFATATKKCPIFPSSLSFFNAPTVPRVGRVVDERAVLCNHRDMCGWRSKCKASAG